MARAYSMVQRVQPVANVKKQLGAGAKIYEFSHGNQVDGSLRAASDTNTVAKRARRDQRTR